MVETHILFSLTLQSKEKCSPIKSLAADCLDKQVRLVFNDNYRIIFLNAL